MIGVVILNYNTAGDVIECVDSFLKQTKEEIFIYIVDNHSLDDSIAVLSEKFEGMSQVKVIANGENKGFSAGNNIGISAAIKDGADYICISNADVILNNDVCLIMREYLEEHHDVGIAAPSIKIPNSDSEAQVARVKLSFNNYIFEKTFLRNFHLGVKKYPRYYVENKKFDQDYIFYGMPSGCFYLARTEFFVRGGLLDEEVFLFNEEDIMAYKAEMLCMKTAIVPKAKIFHNHHSSVKKRGRALIDMHLKISPLIVMRKYEGVNVFKLAMVIFALKCYWTIKSIKDKEYRELFNVFCVRTKEITRIKRKSGINTMEKSD